MAAGVYVLRFERPCRSAQSLFVSNLPSTSKVSTEELWSSLYSAFSQYGLVHKVTLPEGRNYGFVKYYSEYSCGNAQRCLHQHLTVADHTLRVVHSREEVTSPLPPLHVSDCVNLANHYLGFNGWCSTVHTLSHTHGEGVDSVTCEARVTVGEVESVGKATITMETELGVDCRIYSGKMAVNRACEEAFSKLVLVVVEPGARVAAVRTLPSTNS